MCNGCSAPSMLLKLLLLLTTVALRTRAIFPGVFPLSQADAWQAWSNLVKRAIFPGVFPLSQADTWQAWSNLVKRAIFPGMFPGSAKTSCHARVDVTL